jgi:hypothetical protein
MSPAHGSGRALLWLSALLLGILCAVTGCAEDGTSPDRLDRPVRAGDCLRSTPGEPQTYEGVRCSAPRAEWRVLEIADYGGCYDTPGGERAVPRIDGSGLMCVSSGPGVPRPGVNTAQRGDCLTTRTAGKAYPVPCTDPAAVDRVLARFERGSFLNDDCAKTPGSRFRYVWKLTSDSELRNFERKLVFCLAPKDEDPNSSADAARVGDCLSRPAKNYARVACDAPAAQYRVLERHDGSVFDIQVVCRAARGATTGIKRSFGDLLDGYVLCLGPR